MFRRTLFSSFMCLSMFGLAWQSGSQMTFAQNPPATSGQSAPASGGVSTVNRTSYWLEYGIVVLMFGAALYSVCRNSRRNS